MSEQFNTGNTGNTGAVPYSTSPQGAYNVRLNAPIATQSSREIDQCLEMQSVEIDALTKMLVELEQRLLPVTALRPQDAGNANTDKQCSRFSCALANSIDMKTGYIISNRERVERLLADLQL